MMKNPDLLITWIKHCDYPIFRSFLRKRRGFFGKIIIYWSEHFRDMYYDKFIQDDLKDLGNIQFIPNIEYKYGIEDWRNIATNRMLQETNSEWICSVEQDFFAKDWDKLLNSITDASKNFDLLGYKGYQGQAEHQASYLTGNYVHPAFWFMKRELLEKTTKNFSADTEKGCDHFGLITREIEKMKIPIWYTQDNGFPEEDAFHQGGINMNYLEFGKPGFVLHRPKQFFLYNFWSMRAPVVQNTQFFDLCVKVNSELSSQFIEINPETDPLSDFYK